MIISSLATHYAYSEAYRYCTVFMNNQRLSDCIVADEENGVAFVYARDDNGKFIIEDNDLVIVEKFGIVDIKVGYGMDIFYGTKYNLIERHIGDKS